MGNPRTCSYRSPFLVALLLMGILRAATAQTSGTENEKAWFESWLAWLRSASTQQLFTKGVNPYAVMVQAYKQRLAAEGLTPAQVEQRWAALDKESRGNEESTRLIMNIQYANGYYEGRPPSPFLMDFSKGKPPGKALDCGMGAGRNAVFLASLGWKVTGIDVSDTAIERARALAGKAGVTINAVRSSYRDFAWGKEQWDLILNVDSWDGGPSRPGWPFSCSFAAAPVVQALKPGGLLYLENHGVTSFGRDQLFGAFEKIYPSLTVLKREVAVDPQFELRNHVPASSQWEWPLQKDVAIFVAQKVDDARRGEN